MIPLTMLVKRQKLCICKHTDSVRTTQAKNANGFNGNFPDQCIRASQTDDSAHNDNRSTTLNAPDIGQHKAMEMASVVVLVCFLVCCGVQGMCGMMQLCRLGRGVVFRVCFPAYTINRTLCFAAIPPTLLQSSYTVCYTGAVVTSSAHDQANITFMHTRAFTHFFM